MTPEFAIKRFRNSRTRSHDPAVSLSIYALQAAELRAAGESLFQLTPARGPIWQLGKYA